MPKQTKLSEDAEIYKPRQRLSEKEKLKNMSFQDRLSYLWEYYKVHAIVGIVVVALIIYIIHEIVTPNVETQFYAAILNNSIPEDVWDQYETKFFEQQEFDPTTEDVLLNPAFYFNSDAEYAMNMRTVLTTYIGASEVDVIIAPESEFANYAYNDFFVDLSDQLPTDVYTKLADYVYVSDTSENPAEKVVGIYLTDTKLFSENANNNDPYIFGILQNSNHKENSIEFLKMLFNE